MTRGICIRRAVTAAVCLAVLAAVDSSAFKVDIHADVTREALAQFASQALTRLANSNVVPADKREMFRTGFTRTAIEEIVNGNKALDTGDCGSATVGDPLVLGPLSPEAPAVPCATFGSETMAAFEYLSREPPEEHFDREKIQEGSDRIFRVTGQIREHLINGRYTAARRLLGGVLHSLQDFYAHTNWVELGYTGSFERRLGASLGSFGDGLPVNPLGPEPRPRIATPADPMCKDGQRLYSDLTKAEQLELLNQKINPERYWEDMNRRGPLLTSGYFFIWHVSIPGSWADDPEISINGKCRHGYQVAARYAQPGVNKDDPTRRGHAQARRLAVADSGNYVVRLFNDAQLRAYPNYIEMMLGLMGHGKVIDISSVTVGVPRAPGDDFWDSVLAGLGSIPTRGVYFVQTVYPDVLVCLESGNLRLGCANVCEDAKPVEDPVRPYAYVCKQDVRVRTDSNLRVLVREVDAGQPREVIADFKVDDASKCNASYGARGVVGPAGAPGSTGGSEFPVATPDEGACRLQLDEIRNIWVQFDAKEAPAVAPPAAQQGQRPAAGGQAAGQGAAMPQLNPILPPARTQVGPPVPIENPVPPPDEPVGPPPDIADPDPRQPVVPVFPPGNAPVVPPPLAPAGPNDSPNVGAPPAGAPPAAPPAGAPPAGGGGGAIPQRPTAAQIDTALALRDQDSCIGGDQFVPSGAAFVQSPLGQQLGQVRASQLYQLAAFAIAISDPAIKQKVLNQIQMRFGDDAFFGAMTQVVSDLQQSRAIVAGYQSLSQHVVERVVLARLDRWLTPPVRPTPVDVNRWILTQLASDAAIADATGMMSAGAVALSAECVLDELAKDGFAAAVGAP